MTARFSCLLCAVALVCLGSSLHAEVHISGFAEMTQALRVENNFPLDSGAGFGARDYPRGDVRAQLRLSGGGARDEYFLRMDVLSDYSQNNYSQTDETSIRIREGFVKLYLAEWFEAKIGRQIATWGTGDLLFINDLFAKDWVAFFTGQDLAYLKLPQDMLRMSLYRGGTTFEMALAPYYTSDNLPTGKRLSIFNPLTNQTVNEAGAAAVESKPRSLDNAEVFLRVSGYLGSSEWAIYGFRGNFPQPLGIKRSNSPANSRILFAPRLASLGGSVRGGVGKYLVNVEGAFYYSEDDKSGVDSLLPNSSVRLLVGVEKSFGGDMIVSAQWFGDLTLDYDSFAVPFAASGLAAPVDELRHTLTFRATKLLRNQTVKLNFFGYWGVSDEDFYIRPSLAFDFTDETSITIGANWLYGNQPNTAFGQFRDNSNVYLRVRRSF